MNFLKNIPTSAAALLVVMGVLTPVLFLLFQGKDVAPLVTGLYIALAAIAGLGVLLFERSKKSKATGFAKEVESNAASAEGVKDPQRIAQIDHMRKEFQRGIDIYKKHGKDLYSLPWYVVVGESESGKTEMLRRSEIGFPDKLQDRWQGSGGTLSMHWWFSNKAVILDTAGRLFVTEGAEGGQNQWVTFLQMLKKNRPDCPINGLILVIPSNRLLTHPNPDIEATRMAELDRNAGQIAKQMETLQAELGVRFPVYIFITKMDKLNGFREFFGKLDKPEDRYQILGWSNPAPLGSAFDPQSVAEYMRSVADRLNRRMMSELRGVEPESPAGLRIDEVDALYAFPTAFESMTGKLTRYLRHIFTTDEWSAKPPFLRGIYCTSALQQGRVLDEALAAAMGVPLERMDSTQEDDGLSLSRNRTYFVRDLFLDKIFSEKGLVTTAGKIRSSISGWKLWIPAAIILMLVAFGALGLLADKSCPEKERWTAIYESTEKGALIRPLVTWDEQDSKLKPDVGDPEKNAAKTLATLSALGGEVGAPPKFRWIFAPARWFDKSLSKGRPELYSKLVAESLAGLEDALIQRYDSDTNNKQRWTDDDWRAIHALIILRTRTGDDWKGDSGKTGLTTEKLLSALFVAAKHDPTLSSPMSKSINHALDQPAGNFSAGLDVERKRLATKCERDTNDLIKRLLPDTALADEMQLHVALNALVDNISKADPDTALNLPKELATLTVPPSGSANSSFDQTKVLAKTKEQLAEVIRANAHKLGYESKSVELSAAAEALRKQPEILRKLILTLRILCGGTLTADNLDEFRMSPDEIIGEPGANDFSNDGKKILVKLDALKKDWFKNSFIKQELRNHICLPVVKGAVSPASEEELLFLWKLAHMTQGAWCPDNYTLCGQLRKSFEDFFDPEKLKSNTLVAKRWNLNPKSKGESLDAFIVKSGTDESMTFDSAIRGDLNKEFSIDPSKPIVFKYGPRPIDASEDETVVSWGIVDRLRTSSEYNFETSNKKARYLIRSAAAGADLSAILERRPTKALFSPNKP